MPNRFLVLPVLLICSLHASGPGGESPGPGDWVCPDSAHRSAMPSCPGLLAEKVGDAKGIVLASMGFRDTLPLSSLRRMGRSALSGSITRVTEHVHMPDNYQYGLRLGDKGNPYAQAGLVARKADGSDTLELYEASPRLGPAPGGCGPESAWYDCLAGYGGYGLTHRPFLPAWPAKRWLASEWKLLEADGMRAERSGKGTVEEPVSLFYQKEPAIAEQPRFLETGSGRWVFGIGRRLVETEIRKDTSAEFSSSLVDYFVRDVAFFPLSSKGWILCLVETGGFYSDGSFSDLFLLSLHPQRDTVFSRFHPFTGSSGEPGGSTVEGAWWMGVGAQGLSRLFVATAQEGNENGESEDLRITAFEVSQTGEIMQVRRKSFDAVTFGSPTTWVQADSLSRMLRQRNAAAERSGIQALPILAAGAMKWVAGTVAPDAKTAGKWAAWHQQGKVRRVKAAPRK
jgi:hypothetical protein